MTSTGTTDRVRIGDALYSRPALDTHLRPFVTVEYDDGERFATYYIGGDVLAAWAKVDADA